MTKGAKFLTYSLLAVLVGIGIGTAVVRVKKEPSRASESLEVQVANDDPSSRFQLSEMTLVAETGVVRANLIVGDEEGYSLKGNYQIRNLFFMDPGQSAGRWLLQDHQHALITKEISLNESKGQQETVAIAALVKKRNQVNGNGRLMLLDPSGRKVTTVADDVRRIRLATAREHEITLVYERNGKLVRSTFDQASIERHTNSEIEIPRLQ